MSNAPTQCDSVRVTYGHTDQYTILISHANIRRSTKALLGEDKFTQRCTKQFSLGFWDGRALMIDLGALACLALAPREPGVVGSHPELFPDHYTIACGEDQICGVHAPHGKLFVSSRQVDLHLLCSLITLVQQGVHADNVGMKTRTTSKGNEMLV